MKAIKSDPIQSGRINFDPNPIRVRSDWIGFGLVFGSDSHTSITKIVCQRIIGESFWKNNKRGQPRKKKMSVTKYVVACRHGLGFDLDEEVRKLGGGIRMSAKDLP